jgi:hypothetical protein
MQNNIVITLEEYLRVGKVFWAMSTVNLLQYVFILLHIGLAFGRKRLFFAVAASLPPLCLMVIGMDLARWVAFCTVNAMLFHLFTSDSAPTGAARERRLLERNRPVVLAIAVVSALSGPMGVITPPILAHVWRLVHDA